MTLPSIAPAGWVFLTAGTASGSVALPGSPATALVTNFGPQPVFVALGTSAVTEVGEAGVQITVGS